MAITFPASPSDGDVFTNATTGVKYIYNATDGVWKTHVWPTNTNYLQLSGGTLTGNLSLGTNDLTAQDITTTGSVTVGNGLTVSDGNVVMAAGHGIDFSADANAAGMTSELLDDYEEGDFTATFGSVTGSVGTVTYNTQTGSYVKIGSLVWVECRVGVTSYTGTGWGTALIGGLPFANDSAGSGLSQITANDFGGIAYPASRNTMGLYGRVNANQLVFISSGDNIGSTGLNQAQFPGSFNIYFSGVYNTTA